MESSCENPNLRDRARCDKQWRERLNSVSRVIAATSGRLHPIRSPVTWGGKTSGIDTRYDICAERFQRMGKRSKNPGGRLVGTDVGRARV